MNKETFEGDSFNFKKFPNNTAENIDVLLKELEKNNYLTIDKVIIKIKVYILILYIIIDGK